MNHKFLFSKYVALILAMLILVGCANAKADTSPTSEILGNLSAGACPTQSCPAAAALAMPYLSDFRWSIAREVNAIITFEAGDKCTMQAGNLASEADGLMIDVVVNDNTYRDYIVWIEYLDTGKTLNDMKQLTDPSYPPEWVHFMGAVITTPMSRVTHASPITIDKAQGPIYFTCQVNGPVSRKFIDHVGPVNFTAEP